MWKGGACMGRKYASILIRAEGLDAKGLQAAWQRSQRAKGVAVMPDPVQLMGKLGLDSDVNPIQAGVMRALAEKFRSAAARGTGIARRGDVFVLRDMRLGFENVEKAALALSAQVAQAVLFAAVFDEDVYLFGVCKGGTLLGKDVDGEGLAAYGLQQQCMPPEALPAFLGSGYAAKCAGLHGEALEAALVGALNHPLDGRE